MVALLGDGQPPSADHVVGSVETYTEAKLYGPYLLLAFALLGGRALYRDAQSVMFSAMEMDGQIRPIDMVPTARTTRPRWLSNSTTHRATLDRRGLLLKESTYAGSLTDAGRSHLADWLGARGKTVEDYGGCVSDELAIRGGPRRRYEGKLPTRSISRHADP
jgi:hypothetical protein